MTREQILAEAMAFDPKDRESLADEIWLSINHSTQNEIDAAWAQEAEDRIAAHDRGELESEPVEDVIQRLRDRSRR